VIGRTFAGNHGSVYFIVAHQLDGATLKMFYIFLHITTTPREDETAKQQFKKTVPFALS